MTRSALALALAGLLAGPASADVVYTNLGPGDTFAPVNGWVVGGSSGQSVAASFTPAATVAFDAARLALLGPTRPSPITVALRADAGGQPGAVLEAFTPAVDALGLYTLTSAARPTLDAGVPYWLVATSAAVPAYTWMWNVTGDGGAGGNFLTANTFSGGAWRASTFPRPAFEVTGTPVPEPVPEPGTLLTLGLLAGCGAAGWRRRKAG